MTSNGNRLEIFRDQSGDYRWRAISANHQIVGGSEEGYWSKWYCKRKARKQWPTAELKDLT